MGKLREGQSAQSYRSYFTNHVPPGFARSVISRVRPKHAQAVIDAMVAKGKAPSSVRQLGALLHGSFKLAMREGEIAINPFDAVTLPQARRPKLTTPSAEQVRAILDAAEPEYRMALVVGAATGARRGEVCALRWAGVKLEGDHAGCSMHGLPHLHVEGTMQRVAGQLTNMTPKSDSGYRAIPIPPSVVGMLRANKAEQSERRLLLGEAWPNCDLVVDRGDGEPIDPDAFGKAFRRAAARANVSGVRLHELRHGWATAQIGAGVSPAVVSAALGHSQVGFTLTTYVHADAAMSAPLADTTERALGGSASLPEMNVPNRSDVEGTPQVRRCG